LYYMREHKREAQVCSTRVEEKGRKDPCRTLSEKLSGEEKG